MKKTATIKDVAKTLGISVSTVSRVVNGQDRVSPEMRKKVSDAIRRLNYVPSYAAVSIVKKHAGMIAALVPDLKTPLYTDIVQGIEQAARARGYYTMVISTEGKSKDERHFLDGMMGHMVDGVAAVATSADLSAFSAYPKPLVLVDRAGGGDDFDCVAVDNFRGAYMAAEHLVQMGHRRIAIITGDKSISTGHERNWGFEQALRDKSINLKAKYVAVGGWMEKDGYAGAFRLIHVENPPTAIFAAGEGLCRGAIMAFHDLKLRIGKDISLIGFDDSDLARGMAPPVTVVSRSNNEMGIAGANLLLDRISAGVSPAVRQKISLPVKLTIRRSVRDLNGE